MKYKNTPLFVFLSVSLFAIRRCSHRYFRTTFSALKQAADAKRSFFENCTSILQNRRSDGSVSFEFVKSVAPLSADRTEAPSLRQRDMSFIIIFEGNWG